MPKGIVTKRKAAFISPMECLLVPKLPEGKEWTYELKLDGYRAQAVRNRGDVTLYSRRNNVLNKNFDYVADALRFIPAETILDGELVAIDTDGKPNFNMLQNFRSERAHIGFYAFDILMHEGEDLKDLPLFARREILISTIKPRCHVELSVVSTKTAKQMVSFVTKYGLEGVVAKRADSVYQPGLRTGLWAKHRINLGQEFVIGGYVPSHLGLDSIVIGVYRGNELFYAARVRAGFVPLTRRETFAKIKHLETDKCPFVNLPEEHTGRWGQGLTAEKMMGCVWLRPEAVAQVQFLEWTGASHLRHTKFIRLRDDKDPRAIVREA